MAFSSRNSIYSTTSTQNPFAGPAAANAQVTTSTLLATLHNVYQAGVPHNIDASTTLVVNGADGERLVLDDQLVIKAWEHARRRAEDQTILSSCLKGPAPSLLGPLLSTFHGTPELLMTALSVVQAFTHALTPYSPVSLPLHNGLGVTLQVLLTGGTIGATIALSTAPLNIERGLLNIPSMSGYRAFDVFYHMLVSAGDAERSYLGLKKPEQYTLLSRSGTYTLPPDLPTADDQAAAEDFRAGLRAIGIKGAQLKGLLAVLSALLELGNAVGLLVDQEVVDETCEEVAGLLGIDPEVLAKKLGDAERATFIEAVYELLVDWVVRKANEALAQDIAAKNEQSGIGSSEDGDSVMITVLDVPNDKMARALCLKGVFDDESGLNLEMKQDGVTVLPSSSTVIRDFKAAWQEAEQEDLVGMTREREFHNDRKVGVVEKAGREAEDNAFLKEVLFPEEYGVPPKSNLDIVHQLNASRVWYHLNVAPIEADGQSTGTRWAAAAVSAQLRNWRIAEWANRRARKLDFTADFDIDEFCTRYALLNCYPGRDGAENWVLERGWSNGEVVIGNERVWMMENPWWEAEQMLDLKPQSVMEGMGMENPYATQTPFYGGAPPGAPSVMMSMRGPEPVTHETVMPHGKAYDGMGGPGGNDPGRGLLGNADEAKFAGKLDPEVGDKRIVTSNPITTGRKVWVSITWAFSWWIPSFLLRYIGRMKRPDVRMAWREKFVLCMFIFLLNAIIIFYIAFFGRIVCPNYDKAYTLKDVGFHTGEDDYWAAINGKVYDFTDFWTQQHSDINIETTKDNMIQFAGRDLTAYFPPPLHLACQGLVKDPSLAIQHNDTAAIEFPEGIHRTGRNQPDPNSALKDEYWYSRKFLKKLKEFEKGDVVWDRKLLREEGVEYNRPWGIYEDKVYDLTDYVHTAEKRMKNVPAYNFFKKEFVNIFKANPGKDVTELVQKELKGDDLLMHLNCLDFVFYKGKVDFRKTAKCQFNSILLPVFAGIMCAVILTKFLAALQLGSKRRPAMQDKFVICQVPAYTEGEDQLRKALDSLTALSYDNKRKLICVICDGMVVGGGNDKPTPNLVLDILGVDPKIDPPALPFKSVGEGSAQLNYGKVYSGLYEYEGCVVPYIVVVKVGKPSETSKPGNRGKRDSQILLLNFLNRVHHRTPMAPLELEMFHQINNIIGVDPELYEYLLMVDADTTVKEDSLTRLVASCVDDAKIAGICGETSLENEEGSWTTMIQVYEYYISHHLAKAFESLFGSVTCLPGCFCMYRLRTADKGRPLIIADKIIEAYSDGNVDTLHKKNLLSLGEDRYLTTLMVKHFPYMSFKFVPDAYAQTAAPDTWEVLLSQRRRWINSTIHNLAELVMVSELCGFCCFSMRFVVFIDLLGTIILPATCVYIGYLIYLIATKSGAFPLFSIIMIAAVYGLQAIIFIIKRQWQHVGWMVIYILAFPIYSFVLPIYSFWNQDNFTWGSTRIVIGESGDKQIVATDDEGFDPASIPLETWDDYATRMQLPGRRNGAMGSTERFESNSPYGAESYEMDEMRSVYSSVKPASTILLGGHQAAHYPPPHSPGFPARNSTYSVLPTQDYWQDGHNRASPLSTPGMGPSTDNLLNPHTPPIRPRNSALGSHSRPVSQIDLLRGTGDVDESQVVDAIKSVLREVDLDSVTKKQVRVLVEQKLGVELGQNRRQWVDGLIDAELAGM